MWKLICCRVRKGSDQIIGKDSLQRSARDDRQSDELVELWRGKEVVHSMVIVEGFILYKRYAMAQQEIHSNVQGRAFCGLIELDLVGCFS